MAKLSIPRAFLVLCCVVLSFPIASTAQSRAVRESLHNLEGLSLALQSLAETVSPSVVQVFTSGYEPILRSEGEIAAVVARERGTGAGVVVDPEGYVITNAHVVDGARQIQVMLAVPADERLQWNSILQPQGKVVPAQIIGTDLETDLAVLKIPETGLPALELGDSDELRQGQLVLAFGSPLGLTNSVSMGVVSSVARQLQPEAPMIYVQTDATVNPGNSGGPLVNTQGKVVGITTSIFSQSGGSEGIGFAVPSNIVANVYHQIRRRGRVRRGEIGVVAQTITPTLAAGLGLPKTWGVILTDVIPGGTAALAGLQPYDIVSTLNGKVMENSRQLEVNLYQYSVGDIVTLEILRGSEVLTETVGLNERPDEPYLFSDLLNRGTQLIPSLGILVTEIDELVAAAVPFREPTGVFVGGIAAEGSIYGLAFQPGDVIHAVNGGVVHNIGGLQAALAAAHPGDAIVLRVERGGRFNLVALIKEQ
jgi:serine protease Do